MNMHKPNHQAYEDSLKYYRDLKNSLDTAELDGFAKAEQHYKPQLAKAKKSEKEALKIAEAERRQKEEERRQKEEERRQKEEAKLREKEAMQKLTLKMKKYGESIADIIKETGLSSEEIANL